MKKICVALLLGISGVSFAAVVPAEPLVIKKPSIIRSDETKRRVVVARKVLSDEVGSESIAELERYNDVLTMDNVKAIENASRLMQDDPNALARSLGADLSQVDFSMDRRKMGSNEFVGSYVRTVETDDPKAKFAGLHVPELTGSFEGARAAEEKLKELHAQALRQMEEIGRQHLGQKSAPIQTPLTVEKVKEMGIDTRAWPKGWENMLKKSEENFHNAKQLEAQLTDEDRALIEKLKEEQLQKQADTQNKQ